MTVDEIINWVDEVSDARYVRWLDNDVDERTFMLAALRARTDWSEREKGMARSVIEAVTHARKMALDYKPSATWLMKLRLKRWQREQAANKMSANG